jgi:hypothetical protein
MCAMKKNYDKIAKMEAEIRKKLIKFSARSIQSHYHRKSFGFQKRNRILADNLLSSLAFAFSDCFVVLCSVRSKWFWFLSFQIYRR